MTKWLGLVLAVAGWCAAAASPAAAGPFMQTGGRTTQPIGHYQFCQERPVECSTMTPAHAPYELTRKLWATMVSVNNAVNGSVVAKTDMENYGVEEKWAYPTNGFGDCEDYALEKRRRLMALGIPAGDLLMTVVRQRSGEGHAVLTMRTSRGDYVLDNLESKLLAWNDTGYTYLKRQSETNSGVWVKIEDGSADAVASVR